MQKGVTDVTQMSVLASRRFCRKISEYSSIVPQMLILIMLTFTFLMIALTPMFIKYTLKHK